MLGAQLNSCTVTGIGAVTDQSICCSPFSSSHCYSSRKQVSIRFLDSWKRHWVGKSRVGLRSVRLISCKFSFRRFSREWDHNGGGSNREDDDEDYVEATILMSETIGHYRMLMHGSQEETKGRSPLQLGPFSVQPNDPRSQVNSVGPGFSRHFKSPAIFLHISCDGDFVLPITVEGHAVEKLIDSFHEDDRGDCPNQFQLSRNLMDQLGYEVKMVKITERVVNTYFAKVFLHKAGEMSTMYVDARPSDAINIAKRCKAPIYVNKQIVLADATKILHGMKKKKSVYDVTLDSAADGPDLLTEELILVRNMNLAAQEERYSDAAMWRDKLMKLRESK
ncbi:hypothetical protein M9H77_05256 [Catharanthus roseus]|uniref:Uncharacterized protein n=1 Tax=Catharanthus roseus TaxID=4058 RepID=A0ACC0CGZ0_CATRO|nr:hypothetical protein M9H77_05256 [Catharanthus roseus]